MSQQSSEEFIKAAGGLVWRETDEGRQLLLVHRPRYDDWSLPKGKLEPGEAWPEAARREVQEETGYAVSFQEFAGVTTYYHDRRPKVVLFWNMAVAGQIDEQVGNDQTDPEVDRLLWIDADQAAERLTYPAESDLVTQNRAAAR